MLAIISDLHLTDGTSGQTISPGAFEIFAERIADMAFAAGYRAGGGYKPLERLDLLLLGDVLDVIRSSVWSTHAALRPWSEVQAPAYIDLVQQITRNILAHNDEALGVFRRLSEENGLCVPAVNRAGEPVAEEEEVVPVQVNIHYLVGNHDWFFHLPGSRYHSIRQDVIAAMGLSNRADEPFAHEPAESDPILEICRRHRVFARHGDVYDPFNFEGNRDASSLGDAIVVELLNRFAVQVAAELGDDLPVATALGLRELDNVRPLVLIPVWIDGLLERTCPWPAVKKQVKTVWDRLADQFLENPFVRARDTWNPADLVDGLERALKFSKRLTLGWASSIVTWFNALRGHGGDSYAQHALAEQDFRNRRARHIVYGHTHHTEVVPLDASYAEGYVLNQMYFNAGTWRRTHEQTRLNPAEHEFIPSDVMTYLAFFQGDERKGRAYETWSGTLAADAPEIPLHRLDPGRTPHARGQSLSAPSLLGQGPHFAARTAPAGGPVVPVRRVR